MKLQCPHCQKEIIWIPKREPTAVRSGARLRNSASATAAPTQEREWQLSRCPHCSGFCLLREPRAAKNQKESTTRTLFGRTKTPEIARTPPQSDSSLQAQTPSVRRAVRRNSLEPNSENTNQTASARTSAVSSLHSKLPPPLPDSPTEHASGRWIPLGIVATLAGFLFSGWFFLNQAERLQASRSTRPAYEERISISQAAARSADERNKISNPRDTIRNTTPLSSE